ncbi:MAG: SGNH/GDSL hydrolase family protein [Clostridia bacterium]|nr:SGNH/GDSL hydrolase family protein [Clostridia bacterium]
MKLNISQICEITFGAVRIEEREDGIHFNRFTEEQEELYRNHSDAFYKKSLSSSGMKMHFKTNSETLFLKVEVSEGSSRDYFAFDLFVNGEMVDSLENFSNRELPLDYTKVVLPLGEYSKDFNLGTGEKEVCLYFPWSAMVVLKELVLDDDALVLPLKPSRKMLVFGDSITQGYDALHPSNKYITKLAELLDAAEYNKAIGGEIFFPALVAAKEDFQPDYIVVAYGCNDWYKCEKEVFDGNCKAFLRNMNENYPDTPVFMIAPIWRKAMHVKKPFGTFETVCISMREFAASYPNVSVIDGIDFVPHDEAFFGDLVLHPNDKGFGHYYENLSKQVKALLDK